MQASWPLSPAFRMVARLMAKISIKMPFRVDLPLMVKPLAKVHKLAPPAFIAAKRSICPDCGGSSYTDNDFSLGMNFLKIPESFSSFT